MVGAARQNSTKPAHLVNGGPGRHAPGRKLRRVGECPGLSKDSMRTFRTSDLVVPALWGGLAALLAGMTVGRGTGDLGAGVLAGVSVWAGVLFWTARRPLRRARVARQPFPEADREWLSDHVALYRSLSEQGRRRFERDVALALDALHYDAAGGAEATHVLCLGVAAGAAVLLHGHPDWELPTERSVLFVPDTFDAAYGDEEDGLYDGMVHSQGPIVLSTRAVEQGWARDDGHNVVLHELAHVFDFEGWEADGVPAFLDPRSAEAWGKLVRSEMRRAQRGDGVLRAYAGSAPAELFAVATEQFFERPARLRSRHPELYDALVAFYNVTPPDEDVPEAGGSLMARRWG